MQQINLIFIFEVKRIKDLIRKLGTSIFDFFVPWPLIVGVVVAAVVVVVDVAVVVIVAAVVVIVAAVVVVIVAVLICRKKFLIFQWRINCLIMEIPKRRRKDTVC